MIPFGQVLLLLAFGTGLIAFGAKTQVLRGGGHKARALFRRSITASAALLALTFLYICYLFLAIDVSILYVWTYTGTWIPWEYRLAGVWTGREGSLVLWTAFMAATIAVLALRHREVSDQQERTTRDWAHWIMVGLLLAFLLAVVRQQMFVPTESYLLAGRPSGNGINPSLISPYILIHPPMMFLAYAMTIVPAATGIAHMILGSGQWSHIASRVSRINWVLYTFAMGLGGMWAYYTLGFGGYWAWDPVEVANLLPWIALTLYLHAQMMHARKGWFAGVGPMLGVLPFLFTVFSTVSTRSGLWVSVHAFTDPTNTFNPDAAARLLGILDVDASLLPYFGIIVGLLLLSLALWCRRLAMDHQVMPRSSRAIAAVLAASGGIAWFAPSLFLSGVFELGTLVGSPGLGALALLALAVLAAAMPTLIQPDSQTSTDSGWRRYVDVSHLAGLSVLLLSLFLVVAVMWHFGAVNGWSEAFWDARIPWLLTPLALGLTVLMLRGRGRKNALLGAGALLAGSLGAFTIGGIGYYAVFMAGGLLLASLDKMKAVSFAGERRTRWGSTFLWIGALLNLTFWVDPTSELLFGAINTAWPVHLVMIPLAVAGLVGSHLVGAGRPVRWPYILTILLGGYYVAPLFAIAAWLLHRKAPVTTKPLVLKRFRPIGVYGIHFALAVLMLGYATSTYFEERDTFEVVGPQDSFEIGGQEYFLTFGVDPQFGPAETFSAYIREDNQTTQDGPNSRLAWEPQTATYRTHPGVLRLWDRDAYVTLDSVCTAPLNDAGECPPGAWLNANEATGRAWPNGEPSAARITAWTLPGVNGVWAGLGLFVVYGIPMAALPDAAALRKPQPSKATIGEP